jgi:hypothetical protein
MLLSGWRELGGKDPTRSSNFGCCSRATMRGSSPRLWMQGQAVWRRYSAFPAVRSVAAVDSIFTPRVILHASLGNVAPNRHSGQPFMA